MMAVGKVVTEFVFFKVSEGVVLEDSKNQRGQELLKVLQTPKNKEGYLSSAWGRTEENSNAIVWITGALSSKLVPEDHYF
jgi:hypothetical protein